MSSKCIRDTVNKVKTKYQESDPYRLAAAMHIIVKKLRERFKFCVNRKN